MGEGAALAVAFIGAVLMIVSSIMDYSLSDQDNCEDEYETSLISSTNEYEDCIKNVLDAARLASLLYAVGYPILLSSLALAIMAQK
jgi:hypothetical protein